MYRCTTRVLPVAVLLLVLGVGPDTARAQPFFAAQDGTGTSPCTDPATPCPLDVAVADANAASPATVYIRLPEDESSVDINAELTAANSASIDGDITFDTYTFDAALDLTTSGVVFLRGAIEVGVNDELILGPDTELSLDGGPLVLLDHARISSGAGPGQPDGVLSWRAPLDTYTIRLGTPEGARFVSATISAPMIITMIGGEVIVLDRDNDDLERSELHVTDRVSLLSGVLNMGSNNLFAEPAGANLGWTLNTPASLSGDGDFFLCMEEADYPNTRAGAWHIRSSASGPGILGIDVIKGADPKCDNLPFGGGPGGALITAVEAGGEGVSRNQGGFLAFDALDTFHGTFRHSSAHAGARTEFPIGVPRTTITGDLVVNGPGDELAGVNDQNMTCSGLPNQGGGSPTDDESGVFFFAPVTVAGHVLVANADDAGTAGCVEGLVFSAQMLPTDTFTFSVFEGEVSAEGTSGIHLDAGSTSFRVWHNLEVQGNVSLSNSAFLDVVMKDEGASMVPLSLSSGPLASDACSDDAFLSSTGNWVRFGGGEDQLIEVDVGARQLNIPSIQIVKDDPQDTVTILAEDAGLRVATALELIRGSFTTHGRFSMAPDTGPSTLVRTAEGRILRGEAPEVYLDEGPERFVYVGDGEIDTGDEIAGPAGTDGAVRVVYLELGLCNFAQELTLGGNDVLFTETVRLTSGDLDPGTVDTFYGDGVRIEIGNGTFGEDPDDANQIFFPDVTARTCGTVPDNGGDGGDGHGFNDVPGVPEDPLCAGLDGIDLLYFGTRDTEVGIEFPAVNDAVSGGITAANVIRNVVIDMTGGSANGPVVTLRPDETFRINGAPGDGDPLTAFGPLERNAFGQGLHLVDGVLDINGSVLEINATNQIVLREAATKGAGDPEQIGPVELTVYRDTRSTVRHTGYLIDSTDEVIETAGRAETLINAVRRARRPGRDSEAEALVARLDEDFRTGLDVPMRELSKAQDHAGLLRFIGEDDTRVFVQTDDPGVPAETPQQLTFAFPAMEVNKEVVNVSGDRALDSPTLFINASGVLPSSADPDRVSQLDVLRTWHFTLVTAAGNCEDEDIPVDLNAGTADNQGVCPANAGLPEDPGVLLEDGLDVFEIAGRYVQLDGEFQMSGRSSLGGTAAAKHEDDASPSGVVAPTIQEVIVGGAGGIFTEDDGEFIAQGGAVTVLGDFYLGDFLDDALAPRPAPEPGDALFSLRTGGILTVMGDFYVGPNTSNAERGSAEGQNAGLRNRFFLGSGELLLFGNYTNMGTGDAFDDGAFSPFAQGLRGVVAFLGSSPQEVTMRQDEDIFLSSVVNNGEGGVLLRTDAWQNDEAWHRLLFGNVEALGGNGPFDWINLNTTPESHLVGRNTSPICNPAATPEGPSCLAAVEVGSRDSYMRNGRYIRRVEAGTVDGGVVTGGYLFPVGTEGEEVDFFRPLILQFANDLSRPIFATVDYLEAFTNENVAFPGNGIEVADVGGGSLLLDVVGNQFWALEFDRIPSLDPGVRLEVTGMPNIFDIKKLRIIQWDCVRGAEGKIVSGENPRLAGVYDLEGMADPANGSAALNDFIHGVPNVTQEGVNVESCQIFGVASNSGINRIDIPPAGGFARVQFIHNVPNADPMDVYMNDVRVLNDVAFRRATPFFSVPMGETRIDIVAGLAADNSTPLFSTTVTFETNEAYVAAASGDVDDSFTVLVREDVRLKANSDQVEFFTMHGAPDIGEVDLRLMDPGGNNGGPSLFINNIGFGTVGPYVSLAPAGHTIQVTNADNSVEYDVFRFDFSALGGETLAFLISGSGSSASEGFTLIGFDVNGDPVLPQVITDTEENPELPAEFALDGNYPNPFNPSTTIQFDLPETAEVSIQVIDVLGRQVLTVPMQVMEAGSNRTLQVDAASLASGTYIYRVLAQTATETMIKTGRMVLVK